ncbi:MAG: polysaccharide biosynthesis tyrosine autokinase [Acidobacteriota bacterium]
MFDTQEMRSGGLPTDSVGVIPLPPVGGQPIHLLDRLSAVFKHRRVAGTAFLLVVTAMMVQTYSTIPIYQTSARIQIEDERSASVSNLGVNDPTWWAESAPYYRTQYQILTSRELARRVVRRLRLEENPDFNGSAPKPRDPITLVRQARASASAWARSLVSKPVPVPAARPAPDENAMEAGLVSAFIGGITVVPVGDTRLVDVLYRHTNADFAAIAANTLAEEYTAQNLDLRLQNTGKTLDWVNAELATATDKVKAGEESLSRYREINNAQSLDDRQNMVVARLTSLNNNVTSARTERQQKETLYNQVKGADPTTDGADGFALIGNSPAVVLAQNQLATLKAERTSLAQNFGPDAPKMKEVELKVDGATRMLVAERRKVIDSAKNEYEAALAQERNFSSDLDRAKGDSIDLDRKSGDYRLLQRDLDSNQTMYKSLLDQQKSLTVVANSRANNVRLMDRAEAPHVPISPNPKKDWLTAVLAGLTMAFGLAFGIEYLDDTVKTPEDVTRRLKLPLLGLVPAVRGDRVPVLTETVPHDFGEAFRSLRTSLVFTSGGEMTRVIAVTSSQPLEGKTTTACNLALALALGGSRVLLIDADMRRPGLHKTMGLPNTLGLSHLLVGQSRVREVIQKTIEPNLFVITAGRTPPNPSELLASPRMNTLIENLTHGPFDWVVIDTPPVLAVTDAVIIAQKVSGIVFVVGSEMTRRVHAERALETLQAGRVRSIGVVLNRVDFDRNKYYYSRYYGYQYKSYYGQSHVA